MKRPINFIHHLQSVHINTIRRRNLTPMYSNVQSSIKKITFEKGTSQKQRENIGSCTSLSLYNKDLRLFLLDTSLQPCVDKFLYNSRYSHFKFKECRNNARGAITTGPRTKAGAANVLRIIRTTYATSSLRGSRGRGQFSPGR